MYNIKLYNEENGSIINSDLSYQFEDMKCKLSLYVNNHMYSAEGNNIIKALDLIKINIVPYQPMIIANTKRIFFRGCGFKMIYNQELGKYYDTNALKPFYTSVETVSFATYKEQIAYIKIYMNSFNFDLLEKYQLDKKNHIIIKNKLYEFFWIYDKVIDKVYDIENTNGIEKFKQGILKPKWNSLDDFIKWYADNYIQ